MFNLCFLIVSIQHLTAKDQQTTIAIENFSDKREKIQNVLYYLWK